mmetsp:Transcript_29638/g.62328  ORF Transcript_29638/g.62328 Transcript_29638/m.62328 type:complete len:193 (-) Transcript_29638:903-1481(-)
MLSLPGSQYHEDASGADRDNANIKPNSKADQEDGHNNNLNLGPDRPSRALLFCGILGNVAGVVSVLLREHLRSAVSGEDNAKALKKSGRAGEQFAGVINEEQDGINDGSRNHRQNHVAQEFSPADVIVGKRHNKNVLRVASHGKGTSGISGGGERKKVRERVGHLVTNTEIHHNSREDEHDGIVHDCSGSNG